MSSRNQRLYIITTGVLFGFISLAHFVRMVFHLPAQIGDWTTPPWMASFGFVFAGALCFWAFSLVDGWRKK